ncbi:MAG: ABC transporter ATP-binding protein [Desulfobacca sp.]|uniref:ABC transporter ATP-binding protein n=1 Tax=Desulfobacca sp. TaxID=2067990 RepID=UPI0040497DD6
MLKILNLSAAYGAIPALQDVTLHVPPGQIVALIGANGAGKTTLMRAITGLHPPASGKIIFQNREIHHLTTPEIMRRGLALCPEGRRIFPNLTVQENLILGGYFSPEPRLRRDLDGIYQLFPRLAERQQQRAGTLSGGEQQMLALGRALMSRPQMLLLDEPSLGLAPLLVQEVFKTLARINRRGTTMLLVEQNAVAALKLAHYGYVLENGRLGLAGPSQELLHHPQVRSAYLGG